MINYDTVTQRHQISPHAQAFQKKTTLGWANHKGLGGKKMSKMRVSGKLPLATGNWGSLGMSNGGLGCFCGFTDNISSVYHGLNVSLHSTKKLHKVCPSNFCCFRWIWYDGVHRVWSAGSKIPRTGQFAGI